MDNVVEFLRRQVSSPVHRVHQFTDSWRRNATHLCPLPPEEYPGILDDSAANRIRYGKVSVGEIKDDGINLDDGQIDAQRVQTSCSETSSQPAVVELSVGAFSRRSSLLTSSILDPASSRDELRVVRALAG